MFGLFLLGITLLVASVLLRPKPKTNNAEFNRDDTPTTISSRGSFIPVVIGRRRIGYVFGWAANREVRTEVVGTVSSKGKKKKAQTQKVYYESGWHQLCVGQGVRLYRITQQGWDEERAMAHMYDIWQPDGVWKELIDQILARRGR